MSEQFRKTRSTSVFPPHSYIVSKTPVETHEAYDETLMANMIAPPLKHGSATTHQFDWDVHSPAYNVAVLWLHPGELEVVLPRRPALGCTYTLYCIYPPGATATVPVTFSPTPLNCDAFNNNAPTTTGPGHVSMYQFTGFGTKLLMQQAVTFQYVTPA